MFDENTISLYLESRNVLHKNDHYSIVDQSTFVLAPSYHTVMIRKWKQDIESRREQMRNYLIMGNGTLEKQDGETLVEVVATDIPTSPIKGQIITVPPVTTTTAVSFPTKADIIKDFTLNDQQRFACIIITTHLDQDRQFHTGMSHFFFISKYGQSWWFRHSRQPTIDVCAWLWRHWKISTDSFNHSIFSSDTTKQNTSKVGTNIYSSGRN